MPGEWIDDAESNLRGAELMPVLNGYLNELSGIQYSDTAFQTSVESYPGDVQCRNTWGHSKWHEQSGLGLVDLFFLSQESDRLMQSPSDDDTEIEFGLVACLFQNDCLSGIIDGEFDNIIQCIQRVPIFNPNPACGQLVDAIALAACVAGCNGDTLCSITCVAEHAELGARPVPPGGAN